MDKQMIEEMARIMCNSNFTTLYTTCDECLAKKCCGYMIVSKELMKKGFRKIPEGAVVIFDEEMENFAEKLAQSSQMQKVMQGLIKSWKKETTEKFAEMLKARKVRIATPARYVDMVYVEDIDGIAKEITEGKDDENGIGKT